MVLNRTTVKLITQTPSGTDGFNRPVMTEAEVTVPGCVVGSPSSEDVTNELNLSGKRIMYQIFIPKGDENEWTNAYVEIAGRRYRTIGEPVEAFVKFSRIPCDKKISVEKYE